MSEDMAAKSYFSHTDSLGRDPGSRMAQFGYSYYPWGENLAAGNAGASATLNQWANSPGHRANMLNGSFKAIGIGRAYNPSAPYRWYWTTDFGGVVDQVVTPGGGGGGGGSAPVIQSFVANPASITAGQGSALTWNVTGATALSISHGVGSVMGMAGVMVYPTQTTTLTLTASNSVGTTTKNVTITVTPVPVGDTQAPSAPSITSATAKGPTQVDLTWGPSTDNVGVAGYQILRNGAQVAIVNHATYGYSDYGVAANTTYAYTVRAYDGAGNYSAPSNTAYVTTTTQTPPPSTTTCPAPSTGAFTGCYYNNLALTGNPVFTRTDSQVNFDWGAGVPHSSLSSSGYSVRWQGNLQFEGGEYTFTATTSDGMRVFLDGAPLFNSWQDQPPTAYTFSSSIAPGTHLVTVEYYSRTGTSSAHLSWQVTQTRSRRGSQAPPVISFFSATPTTITAGQSSTLSWSVAEATSVTINNGVGNVTGATTKVVSPSQTTTYMLTASNSAGTVYASVTVAVNASQGDTQAPSAPVLTSATAKSGSEVALTWTASSDNVGVTGYQVLRNGSLLTTVPGGALSYSDVSVAGGTTYGYAVRAVDAASNVSPQSNTVSVTTPSAPPPAASCGTPGTNVFTGCYYNNLTLSGAPALVRTDSQVNFDWRNGTPDAAVTSFNFSARWQGNFDFTQGNHVFSAMTSDGMRVYIDGVLVIDGWREQSPNLYTTTLALSQGKHLVTVEYFLRTGTGSAHLNWQQVAGRAGR